MAEYFSEIVLTRWKNAKSYFESLLESDNAWIFRGHYKAEWHLQPSLERTLSQRPMDLAIERQIISEFQRRAHQYLASTEIPQTLLEWLALMQHHGSPTRLLDWTRSPYIAAFIAFEDTFKEEGETAIWAINSRWLAECSERRLAHAWNRSVKAPELRTDEELNRLMHCSVRVVIPMEPERMNERLTIQQGLFLFPSGTELSFESVLADYSRDDSPEHIRKIVLPKSEGLPCLVDLLRMNINAASLFPGLDGFARSLRTIPDIAYAGGE
jgi:hypothetical protein